MTSVVPTDIKGAVSAHLQFEKLIKSWPSSLQLGSIVNSSESDNEASTAASSLKEKLDACIGTADSAYGVHLSVAPFDFVTHRQTGLSSEPKDLIELAKKSSFGDVKSASTQTNDTVRLAYEIVGELNFTSVAEEFLNRLKPLLCEHLFGPSELSFEVNKLNIYPENGHFKKHLDTPKPGVIGTLLIEFPVSRKGGNLSIGFDTDHLHVSTPSGNLEVYAFYPNVPHEVTRVEEGYRVSLSVSIRKSDAKQETPITGRKRKFAETETKVQWEEEMKSPEILTATGDDFFRGKNLLETSRIIEAIDEYFKLSENAAVGFILSWDYSFDENTIGLWKQCDRLFMSAIESVDHKWTTMTLPVLIERDGMWGFDEREKYKDTVSRFLLSDYDALKAQKDVAEVADTDSNLEFIELEHFGENKTLSQDEQDSAAYTGNESRSAYVHNIYCSVALIVRRNATQSDSTGPKSSNSDI